MIDTETTGLDPQNDRIIDIGAVRLDADLAVTDRFTTLVDPEVPIPLFVARLTGISDADVAGAPRIAEALAGLREFAGDATLVGHNAAFDRDHLAAAARRSGTPPLASAWFDTLEAALLLFPELDRHALPILVEELGLSWPAHRALPDAEATAAVLAHLARRAAGLADVERRLLESVSWAPLPVLDACAAQPDEAPPPLVADAPPEGPGPAGDPPRGLRRLARRAGRSRRRHARRSRRHACPASPAASPGFAAAPVRWPTPRPPPTSSPAAASASSRPGPAWARASATCCRRRTPARPPAAASS